MSPLHVEAEPAELGFDAARLKRIDRHFTRYVDEEKLPGYLVLVARRGKIVHLATQGRRDVEAGLPVETDTLFRIYSMTKPITSLAAMMLYEEGAFELTDPVSAFIPSFADQQVYLGGPARKPETRPATAPMLIWHLLTHTSGLTYGFHNLHPVDQMYRDGGFEWGSPPALDLEGCCDEWASMPLLFDPGQAWNYGVSTDVLGRVVEVASGQSLDEFFRTRILEPLGMHDTGFSVPESEAERLAALYTADAAGRPVRNDRFGRVGSTPPRVLAGGQGLVSTARDYHRFQQMLLRGGELDGARVIGSRTLRYMTRNHLPGGVDLESIALGSFSEVANAGKGFGLGFAVIDDPAAAKVLSSAGEFSWGGAASTAFWVDPAEELTVLFLTQLLPSSTHPIRPQLHQLVYQALVD
ncbi:CubicO group peptidase (beta-lactamase class C family) [Saccharopolyspora erythraea NRRL 2338]|uniref:Beta-lactamase n=2 Tax=Saccharopolyspora erythraea TaxID=1836 RepID=A4FBU3_SACEN|nr:serine hydrolase domain-containing protein [Saccharopolyspora erythraea]EQD87550.1 beta-lactamase [Saccharopolyspora erythraea D]PFG95294.1 CubicO group peptidase (beta-lactamase class C family) [Saccharopolyspora erythraea NRRL 2338]QRK91940.1 beta-lactamase family protein [Saccharopolyspora erythraea]CAM01518.1 beta-lactamase [Saccharopolyspora erythraea NRRL 2338]